MAAMFIGVDIDPAVQQDAALGKRLADICPVDIFRVDAAGRVGTVDENLDECTLCDLCIEAAPGRVRVVRLYRE